MKTNTAVRGLAPQSAGVVLGCGIAAVGLAYLAEIARPDRSQAVLWTSLSAAVTMAALFVLTGARYGHTFGLVQWKLGPWSLLWCTLAFGLASITWHAPQTDRLALQIDVDNVISALRVVALGLCLWAVGYHLGPPGFVRLGAARAMSVLTSRRAPEVRSLTTPWLLFAIGTGARLVALAGGRFEYLGQPETSATTHTGYDQLLLQLSQFATLGVAAAALQAFREHRPAARISLTILFAVELGFGAFAGFKENFVFVVLAVIIPYTACRSRFPKLLVIVAAAAFLSLIIPFNQQYRQALRSDPGSSSVDNAASAAPDVLLKLTTDWPPRAVIDSFSFLLMRIREIDNVAIILQRTPNEVPYRGISELVTAPALGFIPRAVWTEKPVLDTGLQFSRDYYLYPHDLYTSMAVTPPGDLLRHGGWPILATGMLLFGILVRLFDDLFDVRSHPLAVFFVLLFFSTLVKYETGFVVLLAGIPETLGFATIAALICFTPRSKYPKFVPRSRSDQAKEGK